MNKFRALLIVLFGLIGTFMVTVDLFAVDNNISGKAPTTNTDATPLTDLASIKIYKGRVTGNDCGAATYTLLTTIPTTTAGATFTYLDSNITQNGRYCYRATALDTGGNESTASNTAEKVVDVLFPSAPTVLTVN